MIGKGNGDAFQGIETRALVARTSDLLKKCKSTARTIKMGRPSRSLSSPGFGLEPPSREVADMMVALYFRAFESTHRILHIPTFWTEYQRYWNHPESIAVHLRLKVLLVIGIGSSLYEHRDADAGFRNMDMVHRWVYTAQTWLSGPLEKDRLDINGLQVYCLLILARQIFSIGGDLVWMSMGSLIHRAMQMGLHHDPKYLPAMSVLQAELRRRLWATILEMVIQSSLDSAMPPRISFDDFDTQPPSNVNDEEIEDSVTTLQPHPKSTYTATSMQLFLLESLPTRLQIVQLLNNLHTELTYANVLSLSSDLTEACRMSSNLMKENAETLMTPFHRNVLDYLTRRFMIPLHCPFISQARTNPLFHYSLKVSLDTAMAIILPEPDESFSRLMVIGGGLFREGLRYASTVISLELIGQVEDQCHDGTLRRNSQSREILKEAMRKMISLSEKRIRQGETNVKSHMFLSMVLAQAEATEAGTPCELNMAQSAMDSLEFCLELLRTRVSTISLPCLDNTGLTTSNHSGEPGGDFEYDLNWAFFMPESDFC